MNPSIQFAVNPHGIDKNWNFELLATGYQDLTGTLADVVEYVKQGHALLAGLVGGQRRSKANIIGSQWILLDVDNSDILRDEDGKPIKDEHGQTIKIYKPQLTLEEAIAHPFIQKHCALIYTSSSHKPEWHKFRLVFLLPEVISDIEAYEAMVRLLMEQLPHDPACKDASRVFYGNTKAEVPLFNPSAALPEDWQAQAIALAEEAQAKRQAQLLQIAAKREQFKQLAQDEGWDTDLLIQQALNYIPPRQPGSNNYDECRQVLMALVDHYGPHEAEAIAEQWSPSIRGTTWNIAQKIKSFRRSGISIGTLFFIAKQYGFRFPQGEGLKKEWGEPNWTEYQAFEQWQREQWKHEQEAEKQRKAIAAREKIDRIQRSLNSLTRKPTIELSQRYIGEIELPEEGSVLLFSGPCGCGKTEASRKLVQQYRKRYPNGKILALGPRNLLLHQLGERLGIHHISAFQHKGFTDTRALNAASTKALCYDSILKLDLSELGDHPLVFLDEIDAGFRHLLQGGTIDSNHLGHILLHFQKLLKEVVARGGFIIGGEADLTDLSIDFLQEVVGDEVPLRLVVNRWIPKSGREIRVFDSSSRTTEEICSFLAQGEPLIVVSDSQNYLEEVESIILNKEQGGELPPQRVVRVDGKTTELEEIKDFMRDPNAAIAALKPTLLLLSPSAESGIDITIPYFTQQAFHLVHLETRSQIQTINRYRLPIPCFGYVKEYAVSDEGGRSLNPETLLKDLHQNKEQLSRLINLAEALTEADTEDNGWLDKFNQLLDPNSESPDKLWLKYWARFQARTNGARANMRKRLLQYWRDTGNTVIEVDAGKSKPYAKLRREAREELDSLEAQKWAAAETSDITVSHAVTILESNNSTLEERRKAQKRLLEDKLPGVSLTSDFLLKAVIQNQGQFLRQSELAWMIQNPEIAKQLDRRSFLNKLEKAAFVWLPKVRQTSLIADLMQRSGYLSLLGDAEYREADEKVQLFKKWALWNANETRRILGLTISREHSAIKILNKFHKKLGYEAKVIRKEGGRGQQERIWRLINYHDVDRDAIITALTRKYKDLIPQQVSEVYPLDTVVTTFTNDHPQKVVTTIERVEHEQLSLKELQLRPGDIATRAGSLGKWLIKSIAGTTASIKQIDSWGFANNIPLDELSLVQEAIA